MLPAIPVATGMTLPTSMLLPLLDPAGSSTLEVRLLVSSSPALPYSRLPRPTTEPASLPWLPTPRSTPRLGLPTSATLPSKPAPTTLP